MFYTKKGNNETKKTISLKLMQNLTSWQIEIWQMLKININKVPSWIIVTWEVLTETWEDKLDDNNMLTSMWMIPPTDSYKEDTKPEENTSIWVKWFNFFW